MTAQAEVCAICGGTGWKTVERGKEREAVRCDCRVKGRADRLLAAAHIPPRYEHCDLANFQYDPDDKNQKSIRDARWLRRPLCRGISGEQDWAAVCRLGWRRQDASGDRHHQRPDSRERHSLPLLRLSRAAEVDPELLQLVGTGDRDGNSAAHLRRRSAGARRAGRGAHHRVGLRYRQLHPQQPLQRQ